KQSRRRYEMQPKRSSLRHWMRRWRWRRRSHAGETRSCSLRHAQASISFVTTLIVVRSFGRVWRGYERNGIHDVCDFSVLVIIDSSSERRVGDSPRPDGLVVTVGLYFIARGW